MTSTNEKNRLYILFRTVRDCEPVLYARLPVEMDKMARAVFQSAAAGKMPDRVPQDCFHVSSEGRVTLTEYGKTMLEVMESDLHGDDQEIPDFFRGLLKRLGGASNPSPA